MIQQGFHLYLAFSQDYVLSLLFSFLGFDENPCLDLDSNQVEDFEVSALLTELSKHFWCFRQDSNLQPLVLHTSTLPFELPKHMAGTLRIELRLTG